MRELLLLARDPERGVPSVLAHGRVRVALALVAFATALSTAGAVRFGREVSVEQIMFGEGRSPVVGMLLGTLGLDLTSVVLYLVQRAWDGIVAASALGPVFIWLLGATAIHAAARLAGIGRPLRPMFVLHGYATGLMRPIADAAGLVLGARGPGAAVAQVLGALAVLWLGVIVWHGIRAHYGVSGGRGLAVLATAIVLFYLVPLALIVVAVVAIVVAAIVLEYFPAR